MKKSIKKALIAVAAILLLIIGGLLSAAAISWHKAGLSYRYIPRVVEEISWRITHPIRVATECKVANGDMSCCDKQNDNPFDCAVTADYSATFYCYKYNQTCRVQADGHCGWDAKDLERVQKCIDDKEYPPLEFQ